MKALAFSGGKDSMACLHLCREELDCAIYVDTGFSYPETRELVEYAMTILPVHVVESHRQADVIPADVVPVDWTHYGHVLTGEKESIIQSYHECCYVAIVKPLYAKAKELGVTQMFCGQRNAETRRGISRDGDVVEGMIRRHPIEDWSDGQVMAYLAEKMDIPAHYAIKHSSLDCFDCTAYRKDSIDRVEWTRIKYPEMYAAYARKAMKLNHAIAEALA